MSEIHKYKIEIISIAAPTVRAHITLKAFTAEDAKTQVSLPYSPKHYIIQSIEPLSDL